MDFYNYSPTSILLIYISIYHLFLEIFSMLLFIFILIVQKRGLAARIKIFLANDIYSSETSFVFLKTLMSAPKKNDKTSSYLLYFSFG